jgi:predicted ATPase
MTGNRRYVLTGGPGGGKTTLLNALGERGYACVPEVARQIIRRRLERGLTPRPDSALFAAQIHEVDVANYRRSSGSRLTFFDRGVVDGLGMLAEVGAMTQADITSAVARYPYNRTVFLLPPWEAIYENDAERDQTFAESVRVCQSVRAWYARCGYETVEVPAATVDERVSWILRMTGAVAPG